MRPAIAVGLMVAASAGRAQQPTVVAQTSGVRATLQAVSPVSDVIVWASGTGGAVVRSLDGGTTWESHPVPDAQRLQFRGLHAISATEAWVMSSGNGPESRIYHTADGGTTWKEQYRATDSTVFFDCIAFFDTKRGVIFSDLATPGITLFRTDDGGEHWNLLPPTAVPAALKGEGAFASSNSCISVIDKTHGVLVAGTPAGRVFRTTDAGATWTLAGTTPVIHDSQAGPTAISFRDARHGILVAGIIGRGVMTRDSVSNAVATTDDGGTTWTLRHRPTQPGMLSGVTMMPAVSDGTAITASYTGVYVSTDRGDSWTSVMAGYYWAVRAAGKRAWAVGAGGRITRVDF
jgi:photosystem II stability/assembly factor-like uncharacterized protein